MVRIRLSSNVCILEGFRVWFLSVGMWVKCTVYIGKDNITGKCRNVDFW